ncbi:uncharacterized protein [Mobula birostris]|uniref:uncharacterized protein n=1 Tax=Mobula birostris TaxID=1983395 RepID=UPI003B27F68A
MDDSETYTNVKFKKTDSGSPSRVEPDVSYVAINFKTVSEPRFRTDRAGLNSTYSELNFRKEEPRIEKDEDPPIASGPGGLPTTAQTGVQKQESKENIGNRPYRKICLLCLVTSILVAIVAGLSIHVSQIRQSQSISDKKCQLPLERYQEMNKTQTQCRQQVHQLKLSNNDCLQNLSVLNNSLAIVETKLRNFKWTMDVICQFLTSNREPTCSKDWITNKDRCYYVSTSEKFFYSARQECSNRDSSLLEINSRDEASFVSHSLMLRAGAYWIGRCENRNVGQNILNVVSFGTSNCGDCRSYPGRNSCNRAWRFICEKSAPLFPDIPENIQDIQDLCQQPVEAT